MKLSIITACLNSEKTLQRAINSVIAQKYDCLEHIFVDGGSFDSTLNIIKKYIELVEKECLKITVKVINQKEKTGITGAWNLALKETVGDIIHILNSDDWYESDTLSSVIETFTKYPKTDIVYGPGYFHRSLDYKFIRSCRSLKFLQLLMPIVHPSTFVRLSVYKENGLFDESYSISADYDFIYRCYKKGVKFLKLNKALVNMQLGGFANSNRKIARKETLNIALKYSSLPILPYLAYFIRKALKR